MFGQFLLGAAEKAYAWRFLVGCAVGILSCMFIVVVIALQVKQTGDSQLKDSFMDFVDPLNPFTWNVWTQGSVATLLAAAIFTCYAGVTVGAGRGVAASV
jgi:hypothetical protein